jgi:hypothetical protein
MINRVTGEVWFQSGLHLSPHYAINFSPKSQILSLKGWKRHAFGCHSSEHGTFEVEALTTEQDHVQIVLLSHRHSFYEKNTPADAERRAFHEGIISLELAGQREFSWGEVLCRLDTARNQDWLVVAYSRDAHVPGGRSEVLLRLFAHEKLSDKNT